MTGNDHDQTPDDILEMTSVFRADFLHEPDPAITASEQDRPPPGSAVLVIKRGPHAGSRHVLGKTITSAGRHPDSDIVLAHTTVSRRHAEFRLMENNDVQIVDVGSLNGIYVNREPVETATLTHGDEVQLGKFHLVFLTGGPQIAK
jgi:pSer/pThr/pTyr-binding forkhead associated (FHA) protein